MRKSNWIEDGQSVEEMHEPTIKHFKYGNTDYGDYDTSILHHDDDDSSKYSYDEPTIKHFQD